LAVADTPVEAPNSKPAKFPYRFEVVRLELTFVDGLYQRPLTSLAEQIGENFDELLVQTLTLSERSGEKKTAPRGPNDEPFAVVDGQTRRAGALTFGVVELPALVYMGLTRADEASLFSRLQRNRRNMMTHERFRAALVAGEPEAKGIAAILKRFGYQVGPRGAESRKTIQAVAALEVLYRRDPLLLEKTIRVIDAGWGQHPRLNEVFSAEMIRGVGRVLADPKTNVDEGQLIARMQMNDPIRVKMNADHLRAGSSGSGSAAVFMAQAIMGVYNSKRRR
jgi:hypothetical protein